MKKTLLILSVAPLLLLQACGGGGNDSDTSTANNGGNASTNTPGGNGIGNTGTGENGSGNTDTSGNGSGSVGGNVSALFVGNAASRYILLNAKGQSTGALLSAVQATSGAMTEINSTYLSPVFDVISNLNFYSVVDVAGDTNFAIGRWIRGNVTTSTGKYVIGLSGTDDSYHYLAYQAVSAFPKNVTLHCQGGNFTRGTYVNSVVGTGDIMFSSSGISTLNGSITVSIGSQGATTLTFPIELSSPATMDFANSNGSSVGVQLADAGNGTYALVIQYAVVPPDGFATGFGGIGVGRLPCTNT